jgi:hypothetical protein
VKSLFLSVLLIKKRSIHSIGQLKHSLGEQVPSFDWSARRSGGSGEQV